MNTKLSHKMTKKSAILKKLKETFFINFMLILAIAAFMANYFHQKGIKKNGVHTHAMVVSNY